MDNIVLLLHVNVPKTIPRRSANVICISGERSGHMIETFLLIKASIFLSGISSISITHVTTQKKILIVDMQYQMFLYL